jgi:hypothetical protein
MPGKRRTNWTRLKQRSKAPRVSSGFSDTEIEESEESFSEVPLSEMAQAFVPDVEPTSEETKKHAAVLSEQLMQLSQDFAVFTTAFEDIYFGSESKTSTIQKAKLALGVVGATLDVVDALHSME